jgi:hypothetical protein
MKRKIEVTVQDNRTVDISVEFLEDVSPGYRKHYYECVTITTLDEIEQVIDDLLQAKWVLEQRPK